VLLLLNVFGAAAENRAFGYCQAPTDQFEQTSPQIKERKGQ
jgi:hypothetical protein